MAKKYIDAWKLCEYANNQKDKTIDANDIMRFPIADVAEVRHARWVEFSPLRHMFSCSLCGQWGDRLWNYCPNCGAKMDDNATQHTESVGSALNALDEVEE